MHAEKILRRFVATQMQGIHASRRGCLIDAVCAVTRGSPLRLSGIARGMTGSGTRKAALKRVDRLLGNARIEAENACASQAIVNQLCAVSRELVIAVDWSSVAPGGGYMQLRASATVPGMGRAITITQRVCPRVKQQLQRAEKELLQWLKASIAPTVRVILISDAGFRRPWFSAISALEWSWIGRIRANNKLRLAQDPNWYTPAQCFKRASHKPRRWEDCELTRAFALACDIVIHRRPRQKRSRRELPSRLRYRKAVQEARVSHKEPWLLACSLDLRDFRPDEIIAFYARRMQIEETFRDTKSATFALGMQTARSRTPRRLLGLLMLAMLATFFLWHLGQLAEAEGLHRRYRATTRCTREISLISLGLLLCKEPRLRLTAYGIRTLLARLGVLR